MAKENKPGTTTTSAAAEGILQHGPERYKTAATTVPTQAAEQYKTATAAPPERYNKCSSRPTYRAASATRKGSYNNFSEKFFARSSSCSSNLSGRNKEGGTTNASGTSADEDWRDINSKHRTKAREATARERQHAKRIAITPHKDDAVSNAKKPAGAQPVVKNNATSDNTTPWII